MVKHISLLSHIAMPVRAMPAAAAAAVATLAKKVLGEHPSALIDIVIPPLLQFRLLVIGIMID